VYLLSIALILGTLLPAVFVFILLYGKGLYDDSTLSALCFWINLSYL